jgi:bifunctional DNA-binding transcriptional regulator/antitoxin component of YhaV-PrlF toxin-antitoxin module
VLPHGQTGAVVGIPSDVRDDVGIEPGDTVDMDYRRDENALVVYLDDTDRDTASD